MYSFIYLEPYIINGLILYARKEYGKEIIIMYKDESSKQRVLSSVSYIKTHVSLSRTAEYYRSAYNIKYEYLIKHIAGDYARVAKHQNQPGFPTELRNIDDKYFIDTDRRIINPIYEDFDKVDCGWDLNIIDCKKSDNILVSKPKHLKIRRETGNFNMDTFDFIEAEAQLVSRFVKSNAELKELIKEQYQDIINTFLEYIANHSRYKKYDVPVEYLKVDNITIRTNRELFIRFVLKSANKPQ